jgi:alpha-mannosidase
LAQESDFLTQQFFQETFGVTCKEAWLPDTFGYASQLPQILRLCGLDYFFTQKVESSKNRESFSSLTNSCPGTTSMPFPIRPSIGAELMARKYWLT